MSSNDAVAYAILVLLRPTRGELWDVCLRRVMYNQLLWQRLMAQGITRERVHDVLTEVLEHLLGMPHDVDFQMRTALFGHRLAVLGIGLPDVLRFGFDLLKWSRKILQLGTSTAPERTEAVYRILENRVQSALQVLLPALLIPGDSPQRAATAPKAPGSGDTRLESEGGLPPTGDFFDVLSQVAGSDSQDVLSDSWEKLPTLPEPPPI